MFQEERVEESPLDTVLTIVYRYKFLIITIAMLAVAFIVLRVLHGVLYLADQPLGRSLVWMGGYGCVLALLGLAALRIT